MNNLNQIDKNMPVVILCGGKGTRLKEETDYRPKALVEIGDRPILWHIMKIYSHQGFNHFVLCLGEKGKMIKEYFMHRDWLDNDFQLSLKQKEMKLISNNHQEEWTIDFFDTGEETKTALRLYKLRDYLKDYEDFMITYGDGVADVNISALINQHKKMRKTVTITALHPRTKYGIVRYDERGLVKEFQEKPVLNDLINGGFWVFNKKIWEHLDGRNVMMVEDTLPKLALKGEVAFYLHEGFWQCMDTYKDYLQLNEMWEKGDHPWTVWEKKTKESKPDAQKKNNDIIYEDVRGISEEIKKEASVLEGKTLLISGGTGFIGSYILDVVSFLNDNFFEDKCKIICLDNLSCSNESRISHLLSKDYFQFINHNISKPFFWPDEIDYIIHAAGIASPIVYRKHPIETIDVNVFGTRNLLELARDKKVKSFLYFSTSEVYGDPLEDKIPTPETYWGNVSCTGPRACYDESKRLAETMCLSFFNKHNIPVKIVRPFNVYGPGLRLEDKRVIPDFVNNALKNEPIVMYSDGTDTRSFCYISDAVKGFFKVLLSDLNGEAFNIGNDLEETSTRELAEIIREVFENKTEIIHQQNSDPDYTKDNPHRRCPDLTKIKELLNYNPKIDLRNGIRRYIDFYGKP